MERHEYAEAVPWFKRAVTIDESRSAPWNNLGAAHARMGHLELAEHAYASAIHVDSENTGAMLGLAQLLAPKNPDLAWKWCERAYELRPKKANVLKVAGVIAMQMHKVEEATAIHLKLLALEPDNKTALFNLSLTYGQRKMQPEFREATVRYLDLCPDDSDACKIFCQVFVDMGQLDEAADVCLRWSKAKGAEVNGTINLAHLLAAQGKHMQGYVFLNKALEKFPRHPGLWLTKAIVLRALPEYRQQALISAENAEICINERVDQPPRVTMADVEPVIRGLR